MLLNIYVFSVMNIGFASLLFKQIMKHLFVESITLAFTNVSCNKYKCFSLILFLQAVWMIGRNSFNSF